MYLLYIDESGSTTNPNQPYFVLSGISIHEKKCHWIEQEMDKIAERFVDKTLGESAYDYELHGSPMRSGKGEWKNKPYPDRIEAIKDCLKLIDGKQIRIFAAVIQQGYSDGRDTVTLCFEQIASRFDMYLTRLHKEGNTQRGIAIFDNSSTEKSIQTLAREFKTDGHSYGKLHNFAEVPLFLDSKASRLIQLADLVSYAIYRKYVANDESFYEIIERKFDFHHGSKHGLYIRENDGA